MASPKHVVAIGAFSAAVLLSVIVVSQAGFSPLDQSSDGPDEGEIGFTEVATEAGLNYTGERTGGEVIENVGVYVTDYDNDNWPDVFVTGGDEPALFENSGGEFARSDAFPGSTVEDRTVRSALFFDYDNDGWEDLLLVPQQGRPVFFVNDEGSFEERDVGLNVELAAGSGATVADFDRDGCLDLFVIQNGDWSDRQPAGFNTLNVTSDNGNPNVLFAGNCEEFTRVTGAGIDGERWSLATSAVDFTGDGYPDVHVANDFNHDVLYVNRGNGSFDRVELGSATNRNGMSSEVGDVNRDSRPEVFVTNIYGLEKMPRRGKGNNLLVGRGGGIVDRAPEYGIEKGGWGWAAGFGDFDSDGDLDLVHATQPVSNMQQLGGENAAPEEPYPVFWERVGDEFRARNASGIGLQRGDGRGLAVLDYDLDGRLDVVSTDVGGAIKLYRNDNSGGNWVQLRIEREGKPVLGTDVYVTAGNRTYYRTLNSKSDFRSQDTRVLHVGTGRTTEIDSLRVVWPDGTEQVFESVPVNSRVVVRPTGISETE